MLSPGISSTDGCAERIADGSTDGATDGSLVGDEGLAVGLADGALGPVNIHTCQLCLMLTTLPMSTLTCRWAAGRAGGVGEGEHCRTTAA